MPEVDIQPGVLAHWDGGGTVVTLVATCVVGGIKHRRPKLPLPNTVPRSVMQVWLEIQFPSNKAFLFLQMLHWPAPPFSQLKLQSKQLWPQEHLASVLVRYPFVPFPLQFVLSSVKVGVDVAVLDLDVVTDVDIVVDGLDVIVVVALEDCVVVTELVMVVVAVELEVGVVDATVVVGLVDCVVVAVIVAVDVTELVMVEVAVVVEVGVVVVVGVLVVGVVVVVGEDVAVVVNVVAQ